MAQVLRFHRYVVRLLTDSWTQDLAAKLDEWSTNGIFNHNPQYITFTLLGLAGETVPIRRIVAATDAALAARQFNKVARAFWEFKLFDTMADFSRFGGQASEPGKQIMEPNVEALSLLRKEKDVVSRVRETAGCVDCRC